MNYTVIPRRGKVGKSREVKAFALTDIAQNSGDLDALRTALARKMKQWTGIHARLDISIRAVAGSTDYLALVYDKSSSCIAQLIIKKDNS